MIDPRMIGSGIEMGRSLSPQGPPIQEMMAIDMANNQMIAGIMESLLKAHMTDVADFRKMVINQYGKIITSPLESFEGKPMLDENGNQMKDAKGQLMYEEPSTVRDKYASEMLSMLLQGNYSNALGLGGGMGGMGGGQPQGSSTPGQFPIVGQASPQVGAQDMLTETESVQSVPFSERFGGAARRTYEEMANVPGGNIPNPMNFGIPLKYSPQYQAAYQLGKPLVRGAKKATQAVGRFGTSAIKGWRGNTPPAPATVVPTANKPKSKVLNPEARAFGARFK